MQRFHGKPIDIVQLKEPVLSDLQGHRDKIIAVTAHLAENETPVNQPECYICGSKKSERFAEIHRFTYVKCLDCGHVYTTYRHTEEAIKNFYKKNKYWSDITYANQETYLYRREHVAKPKAEFAEKFINNKERGVWIDVGSGVGDLVSVLTETGWQAIGLELSESSVKFAKEFFGVSLVNQTFEEYCSNHVDLMGTVDVISFIGLLEHVIDPMNHLELAWKMLKSEGIVTIQVPNAHSIASMVQTVFPENVFRHMSPIEHIMLFTEQSLLKALESKGFEPLALWFHGLDFYELLNNLILENERVQDSALYHAFNENMNELQYVLDKQELSDRIISIAKKKE